MPAAHCANGQLDLAFDVATGATRLHVRTQQPPLRVVRAFASGTKANGRAGAALVHLHNLSGGVLGGDQLRVGARVGQGASALLTSTGSMRIYRHRPGLPTATQINQFQVETEGLLEYLPDSLIPFARSRFCQETTIELTEQAGLFYWEVLGPGRAASGEIFAYDELQIALDITAPDGPIALERVVLDPAQRPLTSLARLGCYRYLATFYICKVGEDAQVWQALEETLDSLAAASSHPGQIVWGISTLVAHGLVIRALSANLQPINQGLPRFWQLAKRTLYNQDAVLPRKVY